MRRFLFPLLCMVAGALCGLAAGLFFSRFDVAAPEIVVREPQAPGESRLSYTPPPPPQFPLRTVTGNPMLKSMLLPKIREVAPGVYLASGYALGNVAMVVTSDGLAIIDATESPEAAREILAEFREVSPLPIRYLIYTHGHLDHVMGSPALVEDGTRVVASSLHPEFTSFQFELLKPYQERARTTQGGRLEEAHAFPLPVDRNPWRGLGDYREVVRPTLLVERPLTLTLGDTRLELIPTSGETPDHLAIWLPDRRVLFTGDLFYQSFPNLSSPMLEARPVRGWIQSIEKFITLKPEHLVPGHTDPVSGGAEVMETLANYRDALRYVHDETVRYINSGRSVEEAAAEIKLPEKLAALPYLQEYYGRVSWSVRGIYRGYTGWYDGQGTPLNPLPPAFRAREVITLAGGPDRVLERAIALQQQGEHQLAAELTELVIAARPDDALAHRVKAASMQYLAFSLMNLNNFGFYRSAYSAEMRAAGEVAPGAGEVAPGAGAASSGALPATGSAGAQAGAARGAGAQTGAATSAGVVAPAVKE